MSRMLIRKWNKLTIVHDNAKKMNTTERELILK